MKKLKRILSMMLVVCMIFTSQAFVTFAEGMENTEAIENETTIEETTVEADDDLVGVKLGETDPVGASSASAEEETAVGEKLGEPEEETETQETLAEEPEEETTVGAKLGEPETEVKTKSKAETEVEEKLFGDPPIYTLSLKPNFPEGFSLPEGSS